MKKEVVELPYSGKKEVVVTVRGRVINFLGFLRIGWGGTTPFSGEEVARGVTEIVSKESLGGNPVERERLRNHELGHVLADRKMCSGQGEGRFRLRDISISIFGRTLYKRFIWGYQPIGERTTQELKEIIMGAETLSESDQESLRRLERIEQLSNRLNRR